MYDYIVIGAGSAGCVVASRLSEDPSNKVLLLEAGPSDWNPMIHMPGGAAEVLKSNSLNWKHVSTPQKNLNNRVLPIPRGKMLGGSSGINGMVYIRGHAGDYDKWAQDGNKGWSFAEVLPYFKRSENNSRGASSHHGVGGPLEVTNSPSVNPLFDLFIKAAQEAGYPYTDDFNGPKQEGVSRFQTTIFNGKRQSTAVAFLKDAKKRTNLEIITGANVSRLLLDGKRVKGVEYIQGGKTKEVMVENEVCICAGTIKSPHILQLSGIGRKEDLESVGIPVQHELPGVGHNLQEHLDVIACYATEENNKDSLNGQDRIDKAIKAAFEYMLFKTGIAAGNQIEAGGFIKTPAAPDDRPDVQLHFVPAYMTDIDDPLPRKKGITVHACNLRPYSKGWVKPLSSDPKADPETEFNFIDDERDWPILIEAFKVIQNIMKAPCWKGVITGPITHGKDLESDEEIKAFIREHTNTVYHPVGTCKMGQGEDAVVDAELKVHGFENLRVADASVIPDLIGGNTNAPAIMIGEKVSDMILGKEPLPPAAL